jgi:hypothetical protein
MAREWVLETLHSLPETAKLPGPKFVFAHITCPHPPFVFGENGEDVADRLVDYSRSDGSGETPATREAYRQGYRAQVAFLTGRILALVDGIMKNSTEPPVIILQADHGPALGLDHSHPERTDVHERMSIFSAYHFPGAASEAVPDTITPVNVFRTLFNAYYQANLPLLKERSYLSTWDRPYDFLDVTDRARAGQRDGESGSRYVPQTGQQPPRSSSSERGL